MGRWKQQEEGGGARRPFWFYLSLLLGRGLNGDGGRFGFPRRGRKGAAGALVAGVAQFVGSPGSRGLQLGVQLAVGRGRRGRQHQRLERCHLCLQDVDLGWWGIKHAQSIVLSVSYNLNCTFTLARLGTVCGRNI